MKSEIFVVNAVKSSERAFSAVARHIDCRDLESLIKILQDPEKIARAARQLGLPKDQVFTFLAQVIHEAFKRQPVTRLTLGHLRALMDVKLQRQLAQGLNYPAQDVLQEIFSVPALQETLEYLGIDATKIPANAKLLLNEILKPGFAQQLEINYMATANNWEPIIENEGWLEDAVESKLLDLVSDDNVANPYQALAQLIDKYKEALNTDLEVRATQPDQIDALGLLEIRRRLSWIIERLYDQAIEISENIVSTQPDSPIMRLLTPIIYIYELGYVAKGIEHFLKTSYKLQDILPANGFFGMPVDEEKIDSTRALVYSEEKTFTLHGEPVGNFEIKCLTNNNEQILLKVNGAPIWVCQQLKKDIPNLAPKDLDPGGDQLYEQLLNTSFPIIQAEITKLKEAVYSLGPDFTQAVVLASDGMLKAVPNAWGDPIHAKLPYDGLPATNDPVYDITVDDLIAYQHTRYGYSEKALRRGMKPASDIQKNAE